MITIQGKGVSAGVASRALRVSLSHPELFRTHLQGKVREVNTYASSPHILNAIADSYTRP